MDNLHIVMFPWLAFGHMLPFLEVAKYLAKKGYQISFISTPRNIKRLPKIPTNLAPLLNFVVLTLPHEDNLPAEAEATTDVPSDKVEYLKKAYDGLESPLAHFLETSSDPADWIIYDFTPHWLPPIAAKLGIPCVYFNIFNATCLSNFAAPSLRELYEETSTNDPEDLLVGKEINHDKGLSVRSKWIPFEFDNNFVLKMYEIKKLMTMDQTNVSGAEDRYGATSSMQGCEVVAVRSCPEFESEMLSVLQNKIYKKPVIPIGLLPPPHVNFQEDHKDDKVWTQIKEWLDKKETKNVTYVALGSEVTLSQEEITELALGLELSELPFFWVLRVPVGSTECELPTGFEERVKGRGFICKSWAPQPKILSHPSVGAFVTHCGWSSVIETLGIGCPMVMLPFINDQGVMAKILQLKNIAFEIPRNNMDGSFTRESVAKSLRKLLIEKEGEPYRLKVNAMKDIFGDRARQDKYLDDFASVDLLHTNQFVCNITLHPGPPIHAMGSHLCLKK